MFEDVDTSAAPSGSGDNFLRWVIDPIASANTFTVNRDMAGTWAANGGMFYTTNIWGRDSLSDINSEAQTMYFEYKRDDQDAVYLLHGCRPSSAVITSEANELPTVEWTFKVGHFEQGDASAVWFGTAFTNPVSTAHEDEADDPYPAIGQSITLTPATTSPLDSDGAAIVYTSWTLSIENQLSPKMSSNTKHGIADWVLTGRDTKLEISNYWSEDFNTVFGGVEAIDVDIQNVVPSADDATQNIIGYRGIVAFHMPTARIIQYPQDSENEDQLTQTLTLEEQLTYDIAPTATAGLSARNQADASGPTDAEIVVAFG
jgi:hypothetical protein